MIQQVNIYQLNPRLWCWRM